MPQILGEYDADRGAAILGLISRGIISQVLFLILLSFHDEVTQDWRHDGEARAR